MKKIYAIGAIACMFAACKPSVNISTPPTAGEAVFTNYLAVGNSFTAGFADNSLTVSGQLNSFPQRLFEQFQTIKSGQGANDVFIQPLLTGDAGYPNPKLVVGTVTHCNGTVAMSPVDYSGPLDSNGSFRYVSTVNGGQINNIGLPGIRVADFPVAGYGVLNPYAKRMFNDLTKRPLDELYYRVYNLHPTFFTLWLGIDDILGFAKAGGTGNGTGFALPITLNIYNQNDITPTQVFYNCYDSILTAITSISSSGAVLNLPDVSALPLFTTVPANGLAITRKSFADTLRAVYSNVTFDKVFDTGLNYYIIRDHNDQIRQAVPGELILLTIPMDSITCAGWGSTKPIPKEYVLTTDELQQIRNTRTTFNAEIKRQCELRHLAYVDVDAFMQTLTTGIAYNGINYTTQYIGGGAFSLDGVHFTPRGYALLANYVIQTINSYYHSTIPQTDANRYPGIKFP